MIQVHHHGLHFAAGSVGFLLQDGPAQSIYDIDCPFFTRRVGRAPHRIDITQRDEAHRHLLDDPLAAWLARPTKLAVVDAPAALVERLAQMHSPTRSLLIPAWGTSRVWRQELSCTNFTPWIMVDASVDQVDLLRAAEQYPRPLLVVTSDTFPAPGGVRLETELDEADLPDPMALQRLGAWAAYERLKRP